MQPAILVRRWRVGFCRGSVWRCFERISLKRGEIQQSNFHDYRLLRMSEAPEVSIKVISTDNAVTGAAEIGVMPIAPAVNNAMAKLIGRPLRAMPMLAENVLKACTRDSVFEPTMRGTKETASDADKQCRL